MFICDRDARLGSSVCVCVSARCVLWRWVKLPSVLFLYSRSSEQRVHTDTLTQGPDSPDPGSLAESEQSVRRARATRATASARDTYILINLHLIIIYISPPHNHLVDEISKMRVNL